GRAVESCEEAVSRGIDLAAAKALQLPAHDSVMSLEQLAPSAIAHLACASSGVDDIGEEKGRQHSIDFRLRANAGEELFDFGHHRVDGSKPGVVVDALQLDPARPRNVLRQVPADLERRDITLRVEHESRYGNTLEHAAHIDLTEDSIQRSYATWARGQALHSSPHRSGVR